MISKRPTLLGEDDDVDVMTVKQALKDIHVTNRLDIARSVSEAQKVLEKEKFDAVLMDFMFGDSTTIFLS